MTPNKLRTANRGFTLVEIAIILVLFGVLLGGILKGAELINNAKVHRIVGRQGELVEAWYMFVDNFGEMPGDLELASVYITNATDGAGDGFLAATDSPLVFQNLASAGYLRCEHCTGVAGRPSADNSLVNTYGGVMSIWHDSSHYAHKGRRRDDPMTHTGPLIPSNIISEVDRKIDDGVPNTGYFRFNEYHPARGSRAPQPSVAQCTKKATSGSLSGNDGTLIADANFWRPAQWGPDTEGNCGGSYFLVTQ